MSLNLFAQSDCLVMIKKKIKEMEAKGIFSVPFEDENYNCLLGGKSVYMDIDFELLMGEQKKGEALEIATVFGDLESYNNKMLFYAYYENKNTHQPYTVFFKHLRLSFGYPLCANVIKEITKEMVEKNINIAMPAQTGSCFLKEKLVDLDMVFKVSQGEKKGKELKLALNEIDHSNFLENFETYYEESKGHSTYLLFFESLNVSLEYCQGILLKEINKKIENLSEQGGSSEIVVSSCLLNKKNIKKMTASIEVLPNSQKESTSFDLSYILSYELDNPARLSPAVFSTSYVYQKKSYIVNFKNLMIK